MDMAGAGGFAAAAISWGVFGLFLVGLATNAWWNGVEDGDISVTKKPPWRPPAVLGPGPTRSINIGFVGLQGSGKSSLINSLRSLRACDPGAAPVGIEETTTEPTPYVYHMDRNTVAGQAGMDNKIPIPGGTGDAGGKDGQDDAGRDGPGGKGGEDTGEGGSGGVATKEGEGGGEIQADVGGAPVAITLWDLPAIGTWRYPFEGCCRALGLEYFDLIAIVYASRLSETEVLLANVLRDAFSVPIFTVRSKIDTDVEHQQSDFAADEAEVLLKMRMEAQGAGLPSVFLTSARHPDKYDFLDLRKNINALVKAGERSQCEAECPICFENYDKENGRCTCRWCRNSMCMYCADHLRGFLLEAPCPFCRRMTSLIGDTHPERLPIWSF